MVNLVRKALLAERNKPPMLKLHDELFARQTQRLILGLTFEIVALYSFEK